MPRNTRALTRAARRRADQRDLPYQQAREDVIAIHQIADEDELSFAEAEAVFDAPGNQLLCGTCGWTLGMVCPECSGCGCNNLTCTGWRHREHMTEEEQDVLYACEECGGDTRSGYDCQCGE